MQLENVLDSTFIIDDSTTIEQFSKLFSHYNKDTTPTLVFEKNINVLTEANEYLTAASRVCNLNFENISKRSFNSTDTDILYENSLGIISVPNNSVFNVILQLNGNDIDEYTTGDTRDAMELLSGSSGATINLNYSGTADDKNMDQFYVQRLKDAINENNYNGKINIPSGLSFNIDGNNVDGFKALIEKVSSNVSIKNITTGFDQYGKAMSAVVNSSYIQSIDKVTVGSSTVPNSVLPNIKNGVTKIGELEIQSGNNSFQLDADAFKGWKCNIMIPINVNYIKCHSLEYIDDTSTIIIEGDTSNWYPVDENDQKVPGSVGLKGEELFSIMDHNYSYKYFDN